MRYLVLGTNTGVGKTFFSALFVKHLKLAGKKVAYVKMVQTGYPQEDDARLVRRLSGLSEGESVVLLKRRKPVAPAVFFERFPVGFVKYILRKFSGYDDVILESSGGLCSPMSANLLNYELVDILNAEAILVVPNRLGCISDAVVSCLFLGSIGLERFFIAVNDFFPHSGEQQNIRFISKFCPGKLKFRFSSRIKIIAGL